MVMPLSRPIIDTFLSVAVKVYRRISQRRLTNYGILLPISAIGSRTMPDNDSLLRFLMLRPFWAAWPCDPNCVHQRCCAPWPSSTPIQTRPSPWSTSSTSSLRWIRRHARTLPPWLSAFTAVGERSGRLKTRSASGRRALSSACRSEQVEAKAATSCEQHIDDHAAPVPGQRDDRCFTTYELSPLKGQVAVLNGQGADRPSIAGFVIPPRALLGAFIDQCAAAAWPLLLISTWLERIASTSSELATIANPRRLTKRPRFGLGSSGSSIGHILV